MNNLDHVDVKILIAIFCASLLIGVLGVVL